MYDIEECTVNESDVTKVFPKWRETWSKGNSEKYKYYYMGFGNGLCVDKSIVNIFENYLESCINEREVGLLMYFFLMSAAYSGLLFGINPFDQEGVEVYKSEVRKNMTLY